MTLRDALLNRFSLTFGAILAIVLGWNVYVAFNDGGTLTGRVVDMAGAPVSGATVSLYRKTVSSVDPVGETVTDGEGRFAFDNHGQFALAITITTPAGTSPRQMVPLWFRNQDVALREPIRVER